MIKIGGRSEKEPPNKKKRVDNAGDWLDAENEELEVYGSTQETLHHKISAFTFEVSSRHYLWIIDVNWYASTLKIEIIKISATYRRIFFNRYHSLVLPHVFFCWGGLNLVLHTPTKYL